MKQYATPYNLAIVWRVCIIYFKKTRFMKGTVDFRLILGGILFGLGWGLVGCCPGPIFILLGTGIQSIGLILLGALLGTYVYGVIKDKLPH